MECLGKVGLSLISRLMSKPSSNIVDATFVVELFRAEFFWSLHQFRDGQVCKSKWKTEYEREQVEYLRDLAVFYQT